ncbi:MAG: type II secretion system protein GspG [Desulfobacter sp.]|nr:MAG: type II secretion system protein GspG [Desulfobacter sp.]
MVEIIRQLIAGSIALGIIVGNADNIMEFYDETVAMSRQIATAGDLRSITIMLDYSYMTKGRLPQPHRFEAWMEKNFKENDLKDIMTDHWGNRLVYQSSKKDKAYLLISLGPDGILDTPDDMRRTGP